LHDTVFVTALGLGLGFAFCVVVVFVVDVAVVVVEVELPCPLALWVRLATPSAVAIPADATSAVRSERLDRCT
jgi:hypothetical protein